MSDTASPSYERVAPPLKWHGGKYYLAPRIVEAMPAHLHYVEPYAGGLNVLLAKSPDGVSEVVNDIDGDLSNFWTVLASPDLFDRFRRIVEAVPFSQRVWRQACERREARGSLDGRERKGSRSILDDRATDAAAFFVICRQSLAGRMKSFAPLSRTRTRGGMNEQASAWIGAVDNLPAVYNRLRRVVVLDARPALDVIRQQDDDETFFYLDPPYLHDTRATTDDYAHEMTENDHAELLTNLGGLRGRFMLSGYRSKLYDDVAAAYEWHRLDFELPNNAASGDEKRRMIESVWCNFKPAGAE